VNDPLIRALAKQAAQTCRSRSMPAHTPAGRQAARKAMDEAPKASSHAPTRYGRKPYVRSPESDG
jgi:hypothetical protein